MTLSKYISSLKDKKITVLGMGISNRPLIRLLLDAGCNVTVRDKQSREKLGTEADEFESKGCTFLTGDDYLENIESDVIFRSPGIHPYLPQISAAVERGAELTSEMEAFFEVCPCPIIAVTGSDGKTTTTTVISEILKNAGYNVYTGGNIGTPLLNKADKMTKDDICVLELSSFQLMTMKRSPSVAVITNLAPNHLDIHKDMEEYIWAKKNIFANLPQPEVVVLNGDNDITASFKPLVENKVRFFSRKNKVSDGFFADEGIIYSVSEGEKSAVMKTKDIFLPGTHNIENYMAAFSALRDICSFEAMVDTAKNFKGVEHRIELVREHGGVRYYNDSIASSPSRTIAGLKSFDKKVILIAGGKDKGVPFDSLGYAIKEYVKTLVVTGMTADNIKDSAIAAGADIPIIEKSDFRDAVIAASEAAEAGDIVILSPASTSFDRFKNFEERGRFFKEIINGLE